MTESHYTLKAYILHTMVYENGVLIAILPPGSPNWMAISAYVSDYAEPPF